MYLLPAYVCLTPSITLGVASRYAQLHGAWHGWWSVSCTTPSSIVSAMVEDRICTTLHAESCTGILCILSILVAAPNARVVVHIVIV